MTQITSFLHYNWATKIKIARIDEDEAKVFYEENSLGSIKTNIPSKPKKYLLESVSEV